MAKVHRECFPKDGESLEDSRTWIEANFRADPRFHYFTLATLDDQGEEDEVVGYILWGESGGFRKEAVLELEQIGITSSMRGRGGGTFLVRESFKRMLSRLYLHGRTLKLVKVTTATDNGAQRLYQETLGAEAEAAIADLYAGDETIMIARGPW